MRAICQRIFTKDFAYSPRGAGVNEKFIGLDTYFKEWIFSDKTPISGDRSQLFHFHQPLLMLEYDAQKEEAIGRGKIIFYMRSPTTNTMLQFLEDVMVKFRKEDTWKMCVMVNSISDLRHKL